MTDLATDPARWGLLGRLRADISYHESMITICAVDWAQDPDQYAEVLKGHVAKLVTARAALDEARK